MHQHGYEEGSRRVRPRREAGDETREKRQKVQMEGRGEEVGVEEEQGKTGDYN